MTRLALTALALALATAPALAQEDARRPTRPAPAAPPAPAPPAGKVKTLTMEGIDVGGDRVTRPLEPISVAEAARSSSLIRIRRDFIDLILKSAEVL